MSTAPEIKAALNSEYRDYVTPGVPASGEHEPDKPKLRAALSDLVDLAMTSGTTKVVATVADLATIPDPQEADRAEVRDDPLGDVPNGNGVWSFNEGSGDWVWISPLLPASATDAIAASAVALQDKFPVPSTQSGTSSLITITPKDATYVPGAGAELLFGFVATLKSNANGYLDVTAVTGGDFREFLLPTGERIGDGHVAPGRYTVVRYNTTSGKYVLVSPLPDAAFAIPATLAADELPYVITRLPGFRTTDGKERFSFTAPSDRLAGDFSGVALIVVGLNDGDSRNVTYQNGSLIGQYAWRKGDAIVVEYITEPSSPNYGQFHMLSPRQGLYDEAPAEVSNQQRFNTEANSQIYALRVIGK